RTRLDGRPPGPRDPPQLPSGGHRRRGEHGTGRPMVDRGLRLFLTVPLLSGWPTNLGAWVTPATSYHPASRLRRLSRPRPEGEVRPLTATPPPMATPPSDPTEPPSSRTARPLSN